MIIHQNDLKFQPITITLETRGEAKVFFDLIDKIKSGRMNTGERFICTENQADIIDQLCNANNKEIII